LLKAALFHDLEEGVTGDIPAPVKWEVGRGVLEDLERRIRNHFEIVDPYLTEDEKKLLKAADFLDACFSFLEQRLMGNTLIDTVFLNYVKYEQTDHLLDCAPTMRKLYHALLGAYEQSGSRNSPWIVHALEKDFWRGEERRE